MLAAVLALASCQYHPLPQNGTQACAPAGGKQCPSGYHCASDGKCWADGTNPPVQPDGGGATDAGDGGPVDRFMPHDALPAPSGHAQVPGGVSSTSATYKMIKTTAQSPGGNRVRESAHYRMINGIVPATQP